MTELVWAVVLLDYRAWQTRFGGTPEIVGTQLTLNGEAYSVIGVLPESFRFPYGDSDVWMTIPHYPNYRYDRNTPAQAMMGRMKDGVSREQAAADLERIAQRLSREYHNNAQVRVVVERLKELQVNNIRPALLVLGSAVALILLIACANLGSVLLARGAARAHDVAIRMALGASRGRIVSQLMAEFLVVALAAGAVSLLVAQWLTRLLVRMRPLPDSLLPRLDAGVLAFAMLLALLVGAVLGIAPALHFSRRKSGGLALTSVRGSTANPASAGVRSALVVAQVAISVMLLAGAALLVQSFRELLKVQPGFRTDHLLTMEYRLPKNRYPTREVQWNFHRAMLDRVQQVPGVTSAAIVLGELPTAISTAK
jgi:putative ABC transport system permease protein